MRRCGGFCDGGGGGEGTEDPSSLECVPTEVRRSGMWVGSLGVSGEAGERYVVVDEHTECGCRCRVKEEVRGEEKTERVCCFCF